LILLKTVQTLLGLDKYRFVWLQIVLDFLIIYSATRGFNFMNRLPLNSELRCAGVTSAEAYSSFEVSMRFSVDRSWEKDTVGE
jgi:hypothetical protein